MAVFRSPETYDEPAPLIGRQTVPNSGPLAPDLSQSHASGGRNLDFLGLLGGLGDIGLAGAGGAAQGRVAQANANQNQDATRLAIQNQQLAAAAFNRAAPQLRMHNAVQGDLLAGLQPVGESGSGRDLHFTGGLSPALLSANTRQLGSDVTRQALLSQLGKAEDTNPNGTNPGGTYTFSPQFTQPTPLPHASLGSKILGGLGFGVKALGSILPFLG